jgi:hypothetical protein
MNKTNTQTEVTDEGNATRVKLSRLVRVDHQYSALCLLRWIRTTNQMVRKMHALSTYYMTTRQARKLVVATYGW